MKVAELWKCPKCGWAGYEPLIVPDMSCGEVVGILDITCPARLHCSGYPNFIGTDDERDKWWFEYYEKTERSIMKKLKPADYDFSRHFGEIKTAYVILTGNDAELYLADRTHFLTVELKVAKSVVKLIHSYSIETKDDLFKKDKFFCVHLSFIGNYILYDEHKQALGLVE
jgi:hypothetical protein